MTSHGVCPGLLETLVHHPKHFPLCLRARTDCRVSKEWILFWKHWLCRNWVHWGGKRKTYIPLDSGASMGSHFIEQESTEHMACDKLYIAWNGSSRSRPTAWEMGCGETRRKNGLECAEQTKRKSYNQGEKVWPLARPLVVKSMLTISPCKFVECM